MFLSSTHRFFFFNDTATTEIYTLSLHDALPILTSNLGGGEITELMEGGMGFIQPKDKPVAGLDAKVERTAVEAARSEEHTSELQSPMYLVCRLLLEKKKERKEEKEKNSKREEIQ